MSTKIDEQKEEFNELVSVVVPIYGVAEYLRQCLDSIIKQTYHNLEIILVDDGSTDGSAEICDEYAQKDSRIIVIHKNNGGLVSARKAGVVRCSGQYTVYCDGDDWIDLEYIEKLTKISKNHRVDMIVSNYIRESTKRIVGEVQIEEGYYEREELENRIFPCMLYAGGFYQFGISQYSNKIFRTELLKKYQLVIPDNISLGEDVALTYPMLLECNSIYICNEPLYHYRFNEDGISLKYRERTASDSENLIRYLKAELPDKYDLKKQLDYYNCLMALTNCVNIARGGLTSGFNDRLNNLKDYLVDSDFYSSVERCEFRNVKMSISKRIGLILLRFKMYRIAVIAYAVKNTITGYHYE